MALWRVLWRVRSQAEPGLCRLLGGMQAQNALSSRSASCLDPAIQSLCAGHAGALGHTVSTLRGAGHQQPPQPRKDWAPGWGPLVGRVQCVLSHVRAGESALSMALRGPSQRRVFGDPLLLPRALPLADVNLCPFPAVNPSSEHNSSQGVQGSS